MKKNDLKSKSIEELWALHAEPTTILSARINDEKLRLEKLIDKLSLISARQRRPYPKVYPKFRNPDPPYQTWSGRGIKPLWMRKLLPAGKIPDDLRISGQLSDLPETKSPMITP
jgi:DNA-binding protein H-NS